MYGYLLLGEVEEDDIGDDLIDIKSKMRVPSNFCHVKTNGNPQVWMARTKI
jgi:hypothetical protein